MYRNMIYLINQKNFLWKIIFPYFFFWRRESKMVKVIKLGNYLSAIEYKSISFVIKNEDVDTVLNKIKNRENFSIESISGKKIDFNFTANGKYQICDGCLYKAEYL